jgi:hypothetical protein
VRTGALGGMSNTPNVAATLSYGFQCVLPRQDFTQAVTKVSEATAQEDSGETLPTV